MVQRVFVEKKPELAVEAQSLLTDIRTLLGIFSIQSVRIVNRYDVEGIDQELFAYACRTVFSEPQLDLVTVADELPTGKDAAFAVEYLPGQFDMRADSAEQCIRILSPGAKPIVRTARVYLLVGDLTSAEVAAIQKYVINPVESREAAMQKPETLQLAYSVPKEVEVLTGFTKLDDEGLSQLLTERGLAMDLDDLRFCRKHFRKEGRDPTITELRMIDTYWSDHCRHTTFLTTIDEVEVEDPLLARAYEEYLTTRAALGRTKPQNLMELATIGARYLKATGKLSKLDESEEINACTVRIKVKTRETGEEDWLLLFKNETHNHPTEIEPFGGAATCIGGAIRDPLSGRSYVYAAMRVTGAADPTKPLSETLAGKLPQKKLVTTAAAGYSSYGNQIGLATGIVQEIYHDGYAAKHMEIGAVLGAAPAENVRREVPSPGDAVILLGGRTGRDGCGGATGSSKSHTLHSLETCGAEVQKGNAPEERKLQRLFRDPEVTRLIKRCNDFGAGGVSVAVGELADGLDIQLDRVPRKYEGLDGTELAISESQERMAVVVAPGDVDRFLSLADRENLEATVIATVTSEPRLVMHWNGNRVVDLPRDFLNSNGAEKHIRIALEPPKPFARHPEGDFKTCMERLVTDLNVASQRGLAERFDSTIGAGTVLMPFGGRTQRTPIQAMVHKLPVEKKHTDTCSFMAWGYDPYIAERSPYHGAYLAVVESVAKLIATGASFEDVYLTFQEYFEKPGTDPKRWGKPLAALLGAFMAQKDYGIASIGGKDSMSGSFESLDVPPTLVSFAVTTGEADEVRSGDLKAAGHRIVLLKPERDADGLPTPKSEIALFHQVHSLMQEGHVAAAYTPTHGGVAEALFKMCLGNRIGIHLTDTVTDDDLFGYQHGAFVLELTDDTDVGMILGRTVSSYELVRGGQRVSMETLEVLYEEKLESVYPCRAIQLQDNMRTLTYREPIMYPSPAVRSASPRVVIPVFPGTNCEYDSARVFRDAGATPRIHVINTKTPEDISRSAAELAASIRDAEILFLPGGFSAGDEPDGSGKFITAFFRGAQLKDAVTELLDRRGGLAAGICNGFQALIKLGLVPFGRILDTDESCPTLTFNTIARHQSMLVRTRVASVKSPWLARAELGGIYTVPISHGEGRFYATDALLAQLVENGQIATQYVDENGVATADIRSNPNNSALAIEGITSPDGRVFGKMGHSERIGSGLYRNVPGQTELGMFASAVDFFKA